MKLSRLFLAASLAVAAFASPAFAAGLFNGYPAAVQPLTGIECIPADTNLTQGIPPATECMTPGNVTSIANANALGVHSNIPIGSVAYGSLGTNTTDINGQVWFDSFQLPLDKSITGMGCLAGGTATTDKIILALYSSTGALLANTAVAGTLLSGASTFQQIAFTTPYVAKAGRYWMAVQGNGTTAGAIRTIAASTFLGVATGLAAGTFGTLPATITLTSTFTADTGPICYIY